MEECSPGGGCAAGVNRRLRRSFGPLLIALAACLLIALAWFGVEAALGAHRGEVQGRAVASTALTSEEHVRIGLASVEQALQILHNAWQRAPGTFQLATWQSLIPALARPGLAVSVTGPRGEVRVSTAPHLVGHALAAVADVVRSASAAAPRLGWTMHGPSESQQQVYLVRPLRQADGQVAGFLVATLDVERLVPPNLAPHSVTALVDVQDGAVAAPNGAKQASVAGSPLLTAMASRRAGLWTGVSPFDQTERVHAFRRIAGTDLAVVVAQDRGPALDTADSWTRAALAFGGSITVLVLLLAVILLRSYRAGVLRQAALAHDRAMLAEKTRQLQATLTGMSDGIMMLDAEQRLIAWNDKFPVFTGVPAGMLRIGLPMADMLRAQARAGEFGAVDPETEVASRLERLHAGFSRGTAERARPNGQVLELRRNPLPGGGSVTLYTDITARRAAEERMREAQKLAALGRLTAGVAHDFNNVLASIIASAELLEPHLQDDPAQSRRVRVVLGAAQRGAGLVQQLLAFARAQPLALAAVDTGVVLLGMRDLLASTLGCGIRLSLQCEAAWPAQADPVQVEHLVLNLAINARDAMPEGGTLTIATANLMADAAVAIDGLAAGDYVALSVADTGTGMTPEVQRSALEPFFTTKPPGRGSGLGLSQVYGIASQSGGGVRIDSEPGRGTTVTVFLPRASAALPAASAEPRAPGSSKAPLPPATVLLVEDEPALRETLAETLLALGMQVLSAEDGAAALRLLDTGEQFDLLLTDLTMPGMDGIQLAAAIRSCRAGLPVVLITGYGDELRGRCDDPVLSKPFVASQLADTLRTALARRKSRARPDPVS